MSTNKYILAIDQGTSSTKSIIFDEKGKAVAKGVEPLNTRYLEHGFVEQDPEEIYQNVLSSLKKCLQDFTAKGNVVESIQAAGISNQRETFVVWDQNGEPLHPAVVWQCKRSVKVCETLQQKGLADTVQQKTGLIIDPYFSATKLIWLFQNEPQVKKAIKNGEAYFGTIDTWLLHKFTNGASYATDHTNASRTLFFNIHSLTWDKELIAAFGLTGIHLPEVKPSAASFGTSTFNGLFQQPIPITAMIGDSHAAAFGEGCFDSGTAKATMGTGCSILMNIGDKPLASQNGMVTTINWSIEGNINYALEGVIVSCGATIEWLKNELQLFSNSSETEVMAGAVDDNSGVYLIPAFSGLGSPYWQMERRASITGMSFGTTKQHIVRAALESVAYQIKDVIAAMQKDTGINLKELMVHGGLTANQFIIQFLADVLNKPVHISTMPDISALGAAYMAGLQIGVYDNMDALRTLANTKKQYAPHDTFLAERSYKGWLNAIMNNV
ncbi:glycerol kinase GlpK [Ilyomonas limi]|uniref:glycerol kinase n=1 Tax=Ilyomonas limi TaxID=2575867 RepID=A0A4U3KWP3_9BACT|nr:glycerol kinase GlpK [Ilyomonas limi]TKK67011.1 glycerol kinase GlpK [Ilyomonas limi]